MSSAGPLAALLAGIFSLLAALHVWWAISGSTGSVAIPTRPDGAPLFRPGPVSTLGVAAALITAALIVLARAGMLMTPVPDRWIRFGTWAVAAAFAARTVGEFRYVGLFRQVRDTPFAHWDAWLFTPLTLAIAIGTAVLAVSARR